MTELLIAFALSMTPAPAPAHSMMPGPAPGLDAGTVKLEWADTVETDTADTTYEAPADSATLFADDEGWPEPLQQDPSGFDFPVNVSGSARMVTEGYLSHGIDPRRPGARWRLAVSPRATLFGEISMSADIMVSTEQTQFDRNISQIGLSPTWRWVTVHVGDFSRDYTGYTVRGVQVRGAGIDLEPGDFRFSIQGGRLLRGGAGGDQTLFERNLIAARIGYGKSSGSHLRLTMVGGRDDFEPEEFQLPDPDTLLVDTMPVDLRPRTPNQPGEGVTVGMDGQLFLLDRLLRIKGEVAASLINRNRTSELVDVSTLDLGLLDPLKGVLTEIQQPRASAAADYAWNLEAGVQRGGARLRGRYEYVGPGFGSLGLPYLVGDRKGYRVDGSVRLLENVVNLQARYQHQTNNLASQRLNTVDRRTITSSVNIRASQRWTALVTGVYTTMVNDAPSDSARLDNTSRTLVTNLVHQRELFGAQSTITLGYNLQQTTDGRPGTAVPRVTTHQARTSVQVPLSETMSVAPSLSGVFTTGDGLQDRTDVYLGFAGNGRFLDGDLRTNANVSTTVSRGRRIFNATARAIYPIGFGADLMAQFRQAEYSAFGDRPAFGESYFTLSVSRSF